MDDESSNNDQFELDVPIFIELKQSSFAQDLGAYSCMALGADQFIGSFKGKTKKSMSNCGDPEYVWTILSSRQMPLFYIDATDPRDSNWIRFIRSTSDATKYNVICMQQNQQINYFTFKDIKIGDELVTYLPKKKKKKNHHNFLYKLADNAPATQFISSSTSCISSSAPNIKQETKTLITQTSPQKTSVSNTTHAAKTNATKIEIKILDDTMTCDDKVNTSFYTINFDLIINDKTKLKRQLVKCDLCPYVFISGLRPIDEDNSKHQLKSHILARHLVKTSQKKKRDEAHINNDTNKTDAQIVQSLIESMIVKIEYYSNKYLFKCTTCSKKKQLTFRRKIELNTHILDEHTNLVNKLTCFFCAESFDLNSQSDYMDHIAVSHKKSILNTLLLSEEDGEEEERESADNQSSSEEERENLKASWIDEYFNNILVYDPDEKNEEGDDHSIDDDKEDDDEEMNEDMNDQDESTRESSSNSNNNNNTSIKNEKSSKTINGKDKSAKIKKPLIAKSSEPTLNDNEAMTTATSKTWTCQLCKKQFDQRVDLSKHQCIEMNLKLLKKKKELRKKKWREAHWKRKIDLSYIESTSLTQLSQNIADNLSFCIDGTLEDLCAYSREVKDYLNTELGQETHMQMFLKCCFPELYNQLITPSSANNHNTSNQLIDANLIRRANSYFIDCFYSPMSNNEANNLTNSSRAAATGNFSCKICRNRFTRLADLVRHHRDMHQSEIKTTFDCYNDKLTLMKQKEIQENNTEKEATSLNWLSSNTYTNSPVGYFGCDPFAYVLNLYWDKQKLKKECTKCHGVFPRSTLQKHRQTCNQDMTESDNGIREENEQEIIIFEPRTDQIKENDLNKVDALLKNCMKDENVDSKHQVINLKNSEQEGLTKVNDKEAEVDKSKEMEVANDAPNFQLRKEQVNSNVSQEALSSNEVDVAILNEIIKELVDKVELNLQNEILDHEMKQEREEEEDEQDMKQETQREQTNDDSSLKKEAKEVESSTASNQSTNTKKPCRKRSAQQILLDEAESVLTNKRRSVQQAKITEEPVASTKIDTKTPTAEVETRKMTRSVSSRILPSSIKQEVEQQEQQTAKTRSQRSSMQSATSQTTSKVSTPSAQATNANSSNSSPASSAGPSQLLRTSSRIRKSNSQYK